jgi:two-component system, NarL family, invasion response regulator UvrY
MQVSNMRILIADDHAVVRRGLREILVEAFPAASFAEARNGEEALAEISNSRFTILVLDVTMPGRSGLDVLCDVKRNNPDLAVIMLSVQPEDQYAMRCLRAGAAAYINKDSAPDELVRAVKKVLAGGHYISEGLAEKLVSAIDVPADKAPHELLSDREHEVMRMLAAGTSVTEIGNLLHVSAKTVSSYRARILDKMHMKTNAELTRYALERKLIA